MLNPTVDSSGTNNARSESQKIYSEKRRAAENDLYATGSSLGHEVA